MPRSKRVEAVIDNPLSSIADLASDEEHGKLKEDFGDYFSTLFKDPKGKPVELQLFHEDLLAALRDKDRVLINIFRGAGKSTLVTVAYVTWVIGNNHDIRIIIACKNESLAKEFLRQITATMKSKAYIDIFGELVPPDRTGHWTDTEKVVMHRSDHATGLTILAIGAMGMVAGRRADLIIVDDCADAKNSATVIQRGHLATWFFEELEPTLEPGGTIGVIGTRWAHMDIYSEVNKSWSKRFPEEFIYILQAVIEKDEKGNWRSVWEKRFPTKAMLAWREDKPLEFSQQMMCDPVDPTLSFLQREWLDQNLVREDYIPDNLIIYFGVDPSWSDKTTADYSVICVGGKDPETNIVYVLDIIRERCDPDRLWQMVKTNAQTWHPILITMEANAAQSFLVRKLQESSTLPINPYKTAAGKTERFTSMSTYFTTRRVKLAAREVDGELHPIAALDPLFFEWSTYRGEKTVEHDDCLDGMDFMLHGAAYGGTPVDVGTTLTSSIPGTREHPRCTRCGTDQENLRRVPEGLLCPKCNARARMRDPRGPGYERLRRMMTAP